MKRFLCTFIIIVLLLPSLVFGSSSPQPYETHYRLDTGVIFAWKNSAGHWQKGLHPGLKNYIGSYTISLANNVPPGDIYDVKVYPYTPSFSFDTKNLLWFITKYATDQIEYNQRYYSSSVKKIKDNIVAYYNNQTGNLQVSYVIEELVHRDTLFNVKEALISPGGEQVIYDYMGLTSETAPADLKDALEVLKPNVFNPNVEGYLYFVPTIIEYKVKKPFDGAINYLFSTFNNYTIDRSANTSNHTFWMMAPEFPGGFTDEFVVEIRSHVINDRGAIERKVFDLTHIKFTQESMMQTINFTAGATPIDATIWRQGRERSDLTPKFKDQFFRGYTKQFNGETYYYYSFYQSTADGEMYPAKKAFERLPTTNAQDFISRYGFANINDYEYRVLNP